MLKSMSTSFVPINPSHTSLYGVSTYISVISCFKINFFVIQYAKMYVYKFCFNKSWTHFFICCFNILHFILFPVFIEGYVLFNHCIFLSIRLLISLCYWSWCVLSRQDLRKFVDYMHAHQCIDGPKNLET